MYKSVQSNLKRIKLKTNLYHLHKDNSGKISFRMEHTSGLLEDGFGFYSTTDVKKNIGPVKTEYFRIALTRRGTAHFNIGLEKYVPYRNCILFGIPGQVFSP